MRRVGVTLLALGLLATLAACAAESTPGPAVSATFAPGRTWTATTTSVDDGRVAIAFVADAATAPQVQRLGRRIAALPQVERYAFMAKEDALEFFCGTFGGERFVAHSNASGPVFSLPMGFWLVLRDADGLTAVTEALQGDPAIRRDTSPFLGVRSARDFYATLASIKAEAKEQ